MGSQDAETINTLAEAIKSLELDDHTIMVASTDLQHYRSAESGWGLDSLAVNCIADLDPVRLERSLRSGRVEMCGGGPAVAVMKAAIARGANRVEIVKYGHSGQVSGDNDKVVGYVAAVLYQTTEATAEPQGGKDQRQETAKKLPQKFELSDDDKKELLRIARRSIDNYLTDGTIPEFEVSDNLQKFGAGFVTLKKKGQLRGCIGYTSAVEPLYKTISDCAVKAAVRDPRFPPVSPGETASLDIEISVLTPMQQVISLEEIEVGRDGLMIFSGTRRGLLLPQVASENNWDRVQFLRATCQKAGLPPDAYKSDETVVYKFQAVIFAEE
jgi:AmmeMemoRadiSam system protein A